MSKLREYQKKRKLKNSKEPKPKVWKGNGQTFCVQRHSARRLHYDFRLELDGVLVSFAVPKGPSMNPKDKRLAIRVEDHPLDYVTFQGVIPAGNYGAGKVDLWDIGTYVADENEMRKGLQKGHVHFFLSGEKLKGAFELIRVQSCGENAWLLIKREDVYAAIKAKNQGKKPSWISPMLAKLVDKPFNSTDWLFEIKWDGYRALAHLGKASVHLYSRNQKLFDNEFKSIVKELKNLKIEAILDGEIVMLDEEGLPRFEFLQGYRENGGFLRYMIFDLLYLDGRDLRNEPLIERKRILLDLLLPIRSEILKYSDHVEDEGILFFNAAKKRGLEGIMGKRKKSPYVSARSSDWVKIKAFHLEDFVIAGFTKPRATRDYFGSLLLGKFVGKQLIFVGHVGTGFDTRTMKTLLAGMKPLIQKKCPFEKAPKTNEPATWVKPSLVAEISFAEWTKARILRQPVFKGLRKDVTANQVSFEEKANTKASETSNYPTNVEKIFWKKENYKKGDMLAYYEAVSQTMVPHLKGRPLTLFRYPDGILGPSFVQKNIDNPPVWLKTQILEHIHGAAREKTQYALVKDARSLLYLANLGTIEFHPMLARIQHLTAPDFLVMDLDPIGVPFKKVVEVARVIKELFDELGLLSYCKTSGGRGLHVYAPLEAKISSEQSLHLAELLAYLIREQLPSFVSLERMPRKRQRRVYIDYLQNAEHKSMIAPYSIRARPKALVSAPLIWSEVNEHLDPEDFNILSVPKRIEQIGDVFAPLLTARANIALVMRRLEKKLIVERSIHKPIKIISKRACRTSKIIF